MAKDYDESEVSLKEIEKKPEFSPLGTLHEALIDTISLFLNFEDRLVMKRVNKYIRGVISERRRTVIFKHKNVPDT